MKINFCLVIPVLIAAVAADLSAAAFADASDPAAEYTAERGADPGRRWKEELRLSPAQARKFSNSENERSARLKPLREKLRGAMVKVQAQLSMNAPESDVQDTLQRILEARKAIAEYSDRSDAEQAAFLSPSQRARLVVWRSLGGLGGYAALRLQGALKVEPREEGFEE